MYQLISQTRNWFGRLLFKQTILVLTVMFCIAVGVALSNMSRLSSSLIESQAVQNAEEYSQSIQHAIDLYSDTAVEHAKTVAGITVTHDYLTRKGGIPLPSTYAIELGDSISEHNHNEMSVRLYSNYPFPWRRARGGPRDDYERQALAFLRQNPNQDFVRFEKQNGHTTLRYGEASLMKATCVACHNTHPDSPKKDWEVGDVVGVWEITQPLDSLVAKVNSGLSGTFVMLGGLSVLGLSGLSLVIGRLRQTAKELEGRVKERTADLAFANTDLEKRNGLIRQVFGRYLSDEVVTTLLESPERLELGGDRRKVTILTSDLRGFTSLSERLSPEEVVKILNIYLEYMTDVITRYQGTIDEFMGDGILVLFGAPVRREDDAVRAVACGCAMQLAMEAVNEKMKQLDLPSLQMGIGINTGFVVVGNIGSEKRTKYSIIGSPVNLTYRIESYTTGGQILISEETLKNVGSIVKINGQKQVQAKGIKQPITVYEVSGIGGFYNLFLPQEEEIFLPIPKEIPLQYKVLEGKHLDDTSFKGSLVKLSNRGAEVHLGQVKEGFVPSASANIKINLLVLNPTEATEDIYAKVLEKSAAPGSFYVRFTNVSPVMQQRLNALYKSIEAKASLVK